MALQLFQAMSEALNNHLRTVTKEKKDMIDEAKKTVTAIRQMEASMDDSKPRRKNSTGEDLKLSYPLIPCLQRLKEKHAQVQKQHKERYEQVKSERILFFGSLADFSEINTDIYLL